MNFDAATFATLVGVIVTTAGAVYAATRKARSDDRKAILDAANVKEATLTDVLSTASKQVVLDLLNQIERLKKDLALQSIEYSKRLDDMQAYIDQVKADANIRLDQNAQGIALLVEQIRAQGLDPVWHPPVPEGGKT